MLIPIPASGWFTTTTITTSWLGEAVSSSCFVGVRGQFFGDCVSDESVSFHHNSERML
jgi:hypothetical protein